MNKAIVVLGLGITAFVAAAFWFYYRKQGELSIQTANARNFDESIEMPKVYLGGHLYGMGKNTYVHVWSEYRWDNDNIQITPGQTVSDVGEYMELLSWPYNKITVTHTAKAQGLMTTETVDGGESGPNFRPSQWITSGIPIVYIVGGIRYPAGYTGISVHRGDTVGIEMTLTHRYHGNKHFVAGIGLAQRDASGIGHNWIDPNGWFFSNPFWVNDEYEWGTYTIAFSFVIPSELVDDTYDVYCFVKDVYPLYTTGGWGWRDDVFVLS